MLFFLISFCLLILEGALASDMCVLNGTWIVDIPRCKEECANKIGLMCVGTEENALYCQFSTVTIQNPGNGVSCPRACRHCKTRKPGISFNNKTNQYEIFNCKVQTGRLSYFNISCNCTQDEFSQTTQFVVKGVTKQYNVYDFREICLPKPLFSPPTSNNKPFGIDVRKVEKRDIHDNQAIIAQITWNIPQLFILTPTSTEGKIFVSWSFNSFSGWLECSPGQCSNTLDYAMFKSTGTLYVKVFVNDTIDNNAQFYIPPTDICDTDNIFGEDFLNKWECHPLWVKIGFVLSCICTAVLSVVVIYLIIKCVCCCMPSQNPGIVINNGQEAPTAANDMWIAMKNLNFRGTAHSVMIFMFLISVCSAQQCTNGVVLSSVARTCIDSGTEETCYFQGNVLISLPYIGSTACIYLNSPESGQNLARLDITYTRSIRITSLFHNYYTSSWNGLQASSRDCHGSDECRNSICQDYTGIPVDYNMWGSLAASYPGRSICTSQCGCAGCGCFICDSSCVYSRSAYQPKGTIAQVFSPYTTMLRPSINVALNAGAQSWNRNIDITAGEVNIGPNISVAIVGSLQGSHTEFGTGKIITLGNNVYLGPAAVSNAPIRGVPGDIQSPTITGLSSPNPNSFIFAPDLAVPQYTTYETTYAFATPGVDILNSGQYVKLPSVLGSTLYTFSNGQLVGDDTQPGALLVSVFTKQPLAITKKVNLVCPNIFGIIMAGCFQCPEGGVLLVDAVSQCNSGPATVSVISEQNITLHTFAVQLGLVRNTTKVYFSSNNKYVIGLLRFTSGSKFSEIKFQGALDNPKGIVLVNETYPPGWVSSSDGLDVLDWFKNLEAPWSYIKWLVVAAIICAVIFAGCMIGYYVYTWVKTKGTGYAMLSEEDNGL